MRPFPRLAGAAMACAVLTLAAAVDAAQLQGAILDAEGSPLVGANLTVAGPGLERPAGTVSGPDGRYVVANLPAGTYDVTVTYVGYRRATRLGVRVGPGETDLDVRLEGAVIGLEQSVVSASRSREKALDAPASISVVEGSDLETRAPLSPVEHARDQPGVDFAKTGLVQSNVVTRGFNNIFSGALLSLTDNRIANVPSLRLNAFNFIPLTNEDIDRIEVVLGPGAALYGPNSANGVMHIITRSPFASAGTSVTVGVGERSLTKGSLRHAGVLNPYLAYKVSAQYYTGTDWKGYDRQESAYAGQDAARGYRATGFEVITGRDTTLSSVRDFDVSRRSVELRLDVHPRQDLTAIATYGYNQSDQIELTGLGAGQALDWKYQYVQTRWLYRDWFAQVYHNWSDAGEAFLLQTGQPIVDTSTLDVFQVQHTAALGARQRFTYGVDALFTRPQTNGTITGQNEGDDDIDEYGAYLQSETALMPQVELVLALRYDDHNRLEDAEVSPRAAVVYKPRETQSVRVTYNRAFSTPTTNDLYLDLVARKDPFGLRALFGSAVDSLDLRAQGTYRRGYPQGFTFRRTGDGRAMYRSSFQPFFSSQGFAPGGAGSPVDAEGYIALDDPRVANAEWAIARGAVLAQFGPQLSTLAPGLIAQQLIAGGMDPAAAQELGRTQAAAVVAALPSIVPAQLPGLRNATMKLNRETQGFDPSEAVDVPPTRSTDTRTLELGYKGIVSGNLVVAADLYRSEVEDFVGPLAVETPSVFLDPASVGAALGPAFGAALADTANAQVAQVLGALDRVSIPGVSTANGDGTAADELSAIFAGGAARIPFGTVSPEQAYDPTAVLLTYRNFGEVTLYGLDLALSYYPTADWSFTGSYSYVSDDFFGGLRIAGSDKTDDVALNAPKNKVKVGASWRLPQRDLRLGARLRYNGGFPMSSGVYVGDVESSTTVDVSARYDLPFGERLYLLANVDNVLDEAYQAFVGAPQVGRLAYLQLGVDF